MSKFKYKYEIVKNIKEIQEARIQKDIAELEMKIHNLKKDYDDVVSEQKKYAEENLAKNCRALDIKYHKEYIAHLESIKKNIYCGIADLNKQKVTKHAELLEKTKEKKIFHKLEEKHLEDHNFEQNKIDNMNLDEIAIQRYTRK